MKTPDRCRIGSPPGTENGLRGLYFGVWCLVLQKTHHRASPTTFHTVSEKLSKKSGQRQNEGLGSHQSGTNGAYFASSCQRFLRLRHYRATFHTVSEGKFSEVRGLSPHSVFASMPGREAGPRLSEGDNDPRAELREKLLICGIYPGSSR